MVAVVARTRSVAGDVTVVNGVAGGTFPDALGPAPAMEEEKLTFVVRPLTCWSNDCPAYRLAEYACDESVGAIPNMLSMIGAVADRSPEASWNGGGGGSADRAAGGAAAVRGIPAESAMLSPA